MGNIMNSTEEIEMSAKYEQIRYMVLAHTASADVDDDMDITVQVPWSEPSSPNLQSMSAVCFLFARNIQNMMQSEGDKIVPMGMVDSDWGGTLIEAWMSQNALDACGVPQALECNDEPSQEKCCDRIPLVSRRS